MTLHVSETATSDERTWDTVSNGRPWLGLALLGGSVAFTLAVLIFFGAWLSQDRIDSRASASGGAVETSDGEWWEDGLIAICPIH